MLIDEIKQANVEAMKNKDANMRSIYSVLINKHLQATILSSNDVVLCLCNIIGAVGERHSFVTKDANLSSQVNARKTVEPCLEPIELGNLLR